METMLVLISGWVDKEDIIYMYDGILFSHNREENLAICNNMDMDLELIILSKIRKRQLLYDIIYSRI